jgi:putative tryptophan/tyrosine transport system substrate-binding protein
MRRRDFITLAGGMAAAWTAAAVAQKDAGPPLIAVLVPGPAESNTDRMAALRAGLDQTGLIEGRHYALTWRFGNGDFSLLPRLVKELDALKPRVIVASANAVSVVHQLLPDTPLVFTGFAADPIRLGLVQSYTRPGGNVTGNVMNAIGGEESLTEKRVGFFREMVPNLKRLGMIGVANGALSADEETALRGESARFGFAFARYTIRSLGDLDAAFSAALGDGVDALYISGEPLLFTNLDKVMTLMTASGKPGFGVYREWGRAGLLMSYSSDLTDGFRHAGIYAGKIVQGMKPADLPVEQASKFTLVVNARTAKQLGITVPTTLLALADEVIE